MRDAGLGGAIRAVLTASPFHGEGHRKVWAKLRVSGVRTSKRRVLRLMRENHLLAPTRVGALRGPHTHEGSIIPETVDRMAGSWSSGDSGHVLTLNPEPRCGLQPLGGSIAARNCATKPICPMPSGLWSNRSCL